MILRTPIGDEVGKDSRILFVKITFKVSGFLFCFASMITALEIQSMRIFSNTKLLKDIKLFKINNTIFKFRL